MDTPQDHCAEETPKPKLVEFGEGWLDMAGHLEQIAADIREGKFENLHGVVVITTQGHNDDLTTFLLGRCDNYRGCYVMGKAIHKIQYIDP